MQRSYPTVQLLTNHRSYEYHDMFKHHEVCCCQWYVVSGLVPKGAAGLILGYLLQQLTIPHTCDYISIKNKSCKPWGNEEYFQGTMRIWIAECFFYQCQGPPPFQAYGRGWNNNNNNEASIQAYYIFTRQAQNDSAIHACTSQNHLTRRTRDGHTIIISILHYKNFIEANISQVQPVDQLTYHVCLAHAEI